MLRLIASRLGMVAAIMLLGGFLGATLVRMAPGFGHDAAALDHTLSAEHRAARRQAQDSERNIVSFYFRYLGALLSGDFGESRAFNRPVKELLAERIPVTLKTAGAALLMAWALGLALALVAMASKSAALDHLFGAGSSLFLCIPSAVLGLLFLFIGAAAQFAIALLVFPKIYRYASNLLHTSYDLPHVLTARAKGLPEAHILLWHVAPSATPQLLALAGVSVALTLSAALPIEVICDIAGIGQLAWSAAQQRDLTLLVNLTLLIALITSSATAIADLFTQDFDGRPA